MEKVYSRYKIFGGFGLLLWLTLAGGFGAYMLLTNLEVGYHNFDFKNDPGSLIAYAFIIGFVILLLVMLATQCRFIIADEEGITFINPILPFLKKSRRWTDFDAYILVDERTRHATHEAVWLIKNEKLKGRFSSFYYANYPELKAKIKTKGGEKIDVSPMDQFLVLMGAKRVQL